MLYCVGERFFGKSIQHEFLNLHKVRLNQIRLKIILRRVGKDKHDTESCFLIFRRKKKYLRRVCLITCRENLDFRIKQYYFDDGIMMQIVTLRKSLQMRIAITISIAYALVHCTAIK